MNSMEEFERDIARELAYVREALSTGNTGRARTAARRAVGCALKHWLQKHHHSDYPADMMRQIRRFAAEPQIPPEIREALLRLEARISTTFESPSTNPLDDAVIIISYIRSEAER